MEKITCRAILEVLGKPKEHVEESLKKYSDEIEKDESISILKKDMAEAKQRDDIQEGIPYYAAFLELEFLVNINKIGAFCFNYMPSSIEVLEPNEIQIKNIEFSDILNDLQSRSHNVDTMVKQLTSETQFLKRNMKTLIKNIILISLKINSISLNSLAKVTGIEEKELVPIIDELEKESKIEKKGDEYCLKT